ncbi:tetratricopeptide repeat-containing sulfotransferase family protein [Oricola sp.]|uniref:tetratricopeptide repeat-containing sulfotransferase family protein n=1 Tax=Oricola sp. TaxID=1979950 RepID=UPI003BAC28D9
MYQQALSIQPYNSLLHANIAHAYAATGAVEEAITHYEKALFRNPNFTEARYGLAQALRDIGEIGRALEQYEAVMRLDPNHASAMLSFSMIADSVSERQQTRIRNAYRNAFPDSDQYMQLNFALGKIEELNKNYASAFYHFREGNRVRDRQTAYSIASTRSEFQQIASTFDRHFFEERTDFGNRDASPIFIVGMPRSGTTLVEQILASHSTVTGAGELAFLPRTVFAGLGGLDAGGFPESAPLLTQDEVGTMARDYLADARAGLAANQVHTDKLPGNFIFIGMIRLMFPKARIIHCTRDPRDTCMSLYKTFFPSGGHHFSYDLDILRDYYCLYSRLMDHWNGLFGDNIIEVNYEALVSNPEQGIRSLLHRASLPFEPKCLEFNKTRRVVRTASAGQVRKPMYTSSIGTWRWYQPHIPMLRESA